MTQDPRPNRNPRRNAPLRPGLFLLLALTALALLLAGCGGAKAEAGPALVKDVDLAEAPAALPEGEDGIAISVSPSQGPVAPLAGASLGTEIPALPERLEIPAIKVDTPVIPVGWQQITLADGSKKSVWEVADYAAGWHKNSALPGSSGNVVISGHNNIKGAVFRKLYTLEAGDTVTVWAGGRQFTYRVDEVMILPEVGATPEQRRQNAQWIQPFDDSRLTLVSCWPETSNTHRVIVVAHLVDGVQ